MTTMPKGDVTLTMTEAREVSDFLEGIDMHMPDDELIGQLSAVRGMVQAKLSDAEAEGKVCEECGGDGIHRSEDRHFKTMGGPCKACCEHEYIAFQTMENFRSPLKFTCRYCGAVKP